MTLVRKSKKVTLFLALAAGSTLYSSTFSSLDINFILKHYLILLPVQLGVLVYWLWWRQRETR